ncbi:MAG: O-antigen ligase family protein [Candidatus Eremiobacteraeota bacterium]|nr:O-antigen ligase family protein [Candidatus Eremiobacteraeota bacterium]
MQEAGYPKKIFKACSLLIVLLVPLVFSAHLYSSFAVIKLAVLKILVLLMIPLALYLYFSGEEERSWRSRIACIVVFYCLVFFVAALVSPYRMICIIPAVEFLPIVILYLMWVRNLKKDEYRDYFLAMVFSGFICSVYALLQHFGIDLPGVEWSQPEMVRKMSIGTMGNPTFLGGFLVMVLPVSTFFLVDGSLRKEPYRRIIFAVIWLTLLVALLFSHSRGAWVALGISHLVMILLAWSHVGSEVRKKIVAVCLIALVAFLLLWSAESSAKREFSILKRLRDTFSFREINLDRLFLWKIGLANFYCHPYIGTGPGSYPYIFSQYRYFEPLENRGRVALPESCHNEVIETASSMGIAGLVLYGVLFLLVFYCILKRVSREGEYSEKLKWIAVSGTFIAYYCHVFFLYSTMVTNVLWCFMLAMVSIAYIPPPPSRQVQNKLTFFQKLVLVMTVLYCIFAIRDAVKPVVASYYLNEAKKYEAGKRWKEAIAAYERVLREEPLSYKNHLYQGKMLEALFREKPFKELPEEIMASYGRASSLNPYDPYPYADIGRFCGYMAENYDREYFPCAEENYRRVIEMDPYNPLFYNDLGNLYGSMGMDDKALRYYEAGLLRSPDSAVLHYNLALYYWKMKNYRKASFHVKKVLLSEPSHQKALDLERRMRVPLNEKGD